MDWRDKLSDLPGPPDGFTEDEKDVLESALELLRQDQQEGFFKRWPSAPDRVVKKLRPLLPEQGSQGAGAAPSCSPGVLEGLLELAKVLLAADLSTDCIKLPQLPLELPHPLRTSVFIRRMYRLVLRKLDAAESHINPDDTVTPRSAFVVTGTPGIGKSAMVIPLISHLAKQKCKIVYRYQDVVVGKVLVMMDFTNSQDIKVDMAYGSDAKGFLRAQLTPRTTVVWDGKLPRGQHSGRVRMVVLSSPIEENWHEFVKSVNAYVWYINTWSLHELQLCCKQLYSHLMDENTVAERFTIFGGTVRDVITKPHRSYQDLRREFGASKATLLGSLSTEGIRSAGSHTLAHIRANSSLEFLYFVLGSPKIRELVYQLLWQTQRQRIKELLVGAADQTALGGLVGMLFEQHGHAVVPHGVAVHLKRLLASTSAKTAKPEASTAEDVDVMDSDGEESHHCFALNDADPLATTTPATMPTAAAAEAMQGLSSATTLPSAAHVWDRPGLDICTADNIYLQPPSTNNPAWDAYYCSGNLRLIMQYTVSKRHGVMASAIQELLRRLRPEDRSSVRMMFVVPSEPDSKYANFPWQPWLGTKKQVLKVVPAELTAMEQWVMQLPLLAEPAGSGRSSGRAMMPH